MCKGSVMSTLADELTAWRDNYDLPAQSGDCISIDMFVGLYRTMNKINDLIDKYLSTTDWHGWTNLYASDERMYINECWVEPNSICVDDTEIYAYLSDTYQRAYDSTLCRNFVGIMDRAWAASAYMADKTAITLNNSIDSAFQKIFGGYTSSSQPCRNGYSYYARPYYEGLVRGILASPPSPLTAISDDVFDKFLEQKRDRDTDCTTLTVASDLFSSWVADQECPLVDLINTSWAMVEALRRNLAFCWIHSNGSTPGGLGDSFSDPDQGTDSDFGNGPRMTGGRVEKVGTFTPTNISVCYSNCAPSDPTSLPDACADSKTDNKSAAQTLISGGSYWNTVSSFNPRPQPELSVYVRSTSHNSTLGNYNNIEHEPKLIKTLYTIDAHWADDEVEEYKSFVIPTQLNEAYELLDEFDDSPIYESDYGHFSDRHTKFFHSGYVQADLGKIKDIYTETNLYTKTFGDGTTQRRLKFGGADYFFNELGTASDFPDMIDDVSCTEFGRHGFKLIVGLIAEMCVNVPTAALSNTCDLCQPGDDPNPPDTEIPIPDAPDDDENTGDMTDLID